MFIMNKYRNYRYRSSVIDNCKRGMKKQVGKSQLFTKTLLSEIQDKMRNACIKSYNKFYDVDSRLKTKQKAEIKILMLMKWAIIEK